ncbi:uncharacterized protein LOC125815000 [Solanum verrucosum]|uniref:uncharacterized protein LOC125815000 n=1 Tax=Solanum verrucosum TaxID=315347 RepID=UPI0020D01B10|nr:uncharacterized protein LOC125815000 [Solanum verrucosum]
MVDSSNDSIPNASASTVRVEIPSPFYLHPSENASSSLLPAVFDGTGYRSWRRAVVRPDPTDPSFQQWERCDDMVTSWILNSLSPDLRDSLQYVNNAQELWGELEERYDQTNSCKLYQLQKEINDLVQGTLDITSYYTKMKKLWEEMSIIDISSQCNCVCTCGGKTKLVKAEQDRRLIHFLMGLNEMYTAVRGNILMMNTLPSMAQAFAILSQEEKQREVKPHNHTALDSTSLNAYGQTNNSAGYRGFRTNYSLSGGGGTSSGNIGFRGNSSTSKSSLFCDYCKKSGHTKDRCYKLHGYPSNPNPRFKKGKAAANVCAPDMNGVQSEEEPEVRRQMPLNLSKDQYEQLLNLLGTLQVGNGASNSDNMLNGAVNLAGILACYSSITDIGDLSCKYVKLTAGSWIIDSRASYYMTYDKTTLTNIISLPYPFLISLPNGYKVKVTEIGDACLNPALTLSKVLFVPSFKFNLISVHCLALQFNGVVSFDKSSCLLQGPSLKSPLELGKAKNGLYFLCHKCHNCCPSAESKAPHVNCPIVSSLGNTSRISDYNVSTGSFVKYSPMNKTDYTVFPSSCFTHACPSFANVSNHTHDDELLWHARLKHVPFVKMKNISTIPVHFSPKQPFTCNICPMARQTRMPFPESITTTTKVFELLHVDL